MFKIFMGSVVSSTEFTKFDLGITSDQTLPTLGKWLKIDENGIYFDDSDFNIFQRRWRMPISLDELIFETPLLKIGVLYNEELRMRPLMLKISELKIDLIVGYLKSQSYNPYELIASGWGCAQTTGIPTVIVNKISENVNYSFFLKINEFDDGVISLSDRYTMISFLTGKNEYTQNNKGQAQEK